MIRSATPADAAALCDLYNPYILTTTATFEEAAISPAEMERRIRDVQSSYPWIVWDEGGAIRGYAYATHWRTRSAYRYSVETSVYVDQRFTGRGIGAKLYAPLLDDLRARKLHTAMAGITLPNDRSVEFHEGFGFRKVAHLEQVGWKFNQWIDVGYWQLLL